MTVLFGKDMAILDAVISSVKEGHKDFELVNQGSIDKYLGLLIRDIDANTFKMSQPFLIHHILDFLSLDENKTKGRDTPVGKPLLNRDLDGVPWKHTWLYRGGVGMLSYLANSVRPEIQMAVHQTACFSIKPMRLHELAIIRIGRYLCNNPDNGTIYNVNRTKGLEVCTDANFAGGWSTANSENADCVLSQTGFIVCYANCLVIWCSKLQTETALSTAEAKNIAMSHALHETIPVQNHIKEINCMFDLPNPMTGFCITLNENNLLAIAIAESLKIAPRTKHSHQISSFLQPSEYIF